LYANRRKNVISRGDGQETTFHRDIFNKFQSRFGDPNDKVKPETGAKTRHRQKHI